MSTSEFGYITSQDQSFGNNKGIFSPTDIYDLTRADKYTNYGQLELIETQTVSSVSQVDFTNLSNYNVHFFTLNNFHCDDNKDLNVRTLVGGSVQSGGSDYGRAFQACAPSYYYEDRDASLDRLRIIPEVGNATGECLNGYIYMYHALDNTKFTFFTTQFSAVKYDGKTLNNFGTGSYQQSNSLSGIRFYMSSGNINEADISIYGVKEYS
tara:strand:+ start:149 stop:778 length:630 start_codon:yes stop_codon:yes gene_type:complete